VPNFSQEAMKFRFGLNFWGMVLRHWIN